MGGYWICHLGLFYFLQSLAMGVSVVSTYASILNIHNGDNVSTGDLIDTQPASQTTCEYGQNVNCSLSLDPRLFFDYQNKTWVLWEFKRNLSIDRCNPCYYSSLIFNKLIGTMYTSRYYYRQYLPIYQWMKDLRGAYWMEAIGS